MDDIASNLLRVLYIPTEEIQTSFWNMAICGYKWVCISVANTCIENNGTTEKPKNNIIKACILT